MAQIFPTDFEEKLTMAQDDYILFSDSEDGNKIKKAQYSNLKGEQGDPGTAATITVGSTTTGAAGSAASVVNSGTSTAAVLDFTIPKGDTGATGSAATISVGSTTTGNPGTSASVTNSGTSSAAVFDFTIPRGEKGDTGATGAAATISVGSTTTGDAGTSASVVNSGTSSAAVLDFTIPKGDKGDTGNTGATGNGIASITSSKVGKTTTVTITETNGDTDSFQIEDGADGQGSGDVIGPNSSTDGHLAVFDGTTGKLIKDGGAVPTPTTVVDNLTTQSSTSALSANQGYVLDGKIADLMALGKFLSLWNSTTGQPISFPLQTPYTYSTGDYFLVETVSTATPPVNYKPNGSSYTGTASSTTESDELEVGDVYIYDGTTWLLQSNHGKTVSFTNIAGDAMDNVSLSGYLNTKAFYLSSTSDLTTAQAAYGWQNGGKTALIIYNDKPYTYLSGNAASMNFKCLYPYEKSSNQTGKTELVQDALVFSLSSGTVTSISANSRYNTISAYLNTDQNYTTPYTPQYDGSPATKKYVDDKHDVISVTLASANWSSKSITVSATGVTASNTVIVSPAPANINDYASNFVYCSVQGSGTLTFSCNTEPTVDIDVNVLIFN